MGVLETTALFGEYHVVGQWHGYIVSRDLQNPHEQKKWLDLARSAEAPHSLLGVWDECAGVERYSN